MKKKSLAWLSAALIVAAVAGYALLQSGEVLASRDTHGKYYPLPRTTEVTQLYCIIEGVQTEVSQHVVHTATSWCEGDSVVCEFSPVVPVGVPCARVLARLLHTGYDITLAQSDEFAFDVHYTLVRTRELKKPRFGK
jgi:hypothetical protein